MLSTEAMGSAAFAGLEAGNASSRVQKGPGPPQTPQPSLLHGASGRSLLKGIVFGSPVTLKITKNSSCVHSQFKRI